MQRARTHNDLVVVSIFVNPLQFGPDEDFEDYPRDLDSDLQLCVDSGVDLVFIPELGEMFGEPPVTTVTVGSLGKVLCGTSRPGHFDGVATTVAKLFAMVGRCSAYFGEKDFQQLRVVQRMTADLSLPVNVVGCPTVREPDGLALSSRNIYLTPSERAQATVLRRALEVGVSTMATGESRSDVVCDAMEAVIASAPLAQLDYAAAVSASDLTNINPLTGEVRLLVAARFGKARLIDNIDSKVNINHKVLEG